MSRNLNKLIDEMLATEDESAAVWIDCKKVVRLEQEATCPECGGGHIVSQITVYKPPLY